MSATKFFSGLTVGALVLFGVGAWMIAQHRADDKVLAQQNESLSVPQVAVIHPSTTAAEDDLVIPGTMQAFAEAGVYARTSGYLKAWHADLGTRVTAGQLLAEIDTPEADRELEQVRAARQQLAASLELAKSSAARWENLRTTDAVSQQEVDERKAAVVQQQASLAAADANIRRLEELASYRKVFAPFAGVITKRNVDVGALITSGNSAQQLLFNVAQTSPLRVFVSLPEAYSVGVKPGLTAWLDVAEYPGRKFTGTVTRTAQVLDPGTRTLLTQIDVPNADAALMPGGYASVHLKMTVAAERLQIPVNAMLFRAEGVQAVVVDDQNITHLKSITIGRDFGTTVEVLQGLSATDWVVMNPSDSIADKQPVHPQKPAEGAPKK
jgi:membrane fusion protein, multidrug efflux system